MGYRYPDYAVMVYDKEPCFDLSDELLFMGQLLDSDEHWQFYKAEKYERPSNDELKHLKAIIFPGS